jgi:hypothetical protein
MLYWFRRLMKADQGEGGTPSADPEAPVDQTPPPANSDTGAKPEEGNKGAGSKEAVLADLARERDRRQGLESEVSTLKEKLVENEQRFDNLSNAILKSIGKGEEEDPEAALEQAKKSNAVLTGKAKMALLRARVETEASSLNCHDPAAVFAVGNTAGIFDGVEVDLDKAQVGDVRSIIEKMVEESPWLARMPADPPAGGSPPASDPDPEKIDKAGLEQLVKKAKEGDPIAQIQVSKNLKRIQELGLA